jgi:hypothetical protein
LLLLRECEKVLGRDHSVLGRAIRRHPALYAKALEAAWRAASPGPAIEAFNKALRVETKLRILAAMLRKKHLAQADSAWDTIDQLMKNPKTPAGTKFSVAKWIIDTNLSFGRR